MTAVQNLSSDDEIKDVENPIEDPSTEASAEDLSQLQQLQEDEHDGGYGWVCVVCQLMITASTWGVNGVSPPLFLKYILPYYETKTLINLNDRLSVSTSLTTSPQTNSPARPKSPTPSSVVYLSPKSSS